MTQGKAVRESDRSKGTMTVRLEDWTMTPHIVGGVEAHVPILLERRGDGSGKNEKSDDDHDDADLHCCSTGRRMMMMMVVIDAYGCTVMTISKSTGRSARNWTNGERIICGDAKEHQQSQRYHFVCTGTCMVCGCYPAPITIPLPCMTRVFVMRTDPKDPR